MPIYDFTETGERIKPTRQRMVHGGWGDLVVGVDLKTDQLTIAEAKREHAIGEFVEKEDEDADPVVVLAFDSVESLDVFLTFAALLRVSMEEKAALKEAIDANR